MSEINADMLRQVINTPDPTLEAFSMLLRSVAGDAVEAVAITLGMLGQDPAKLPGEYFAQAVLVEADKVFLPISRERWIEIFDSYHEIKNIVANDPVLKAEVEARNNERRANTPKEDAPSLLDGNF
jgi:hypothetical protein